MKGRRGLTLVEMLLTFSLVAILATVAWVSFWGARLNQAVNASAQNLEIVLQRARIYSREEKDGLAWGIKESSAGSYDLVSGNRASTTVVARYYLDDPVKFAGEGFEVWFAPGNGEADVEQRVRLVTPRGREVEVEVAKSGLISINGEP